jgi:hypothetical protein
MAGLSSRRRRRGAQNLVEKEKEGTLDPDFDARRSSWRLASLWYQMMCLPNCAAETNSEAGPINATAEKKNWPITCTYIQSLQAWPGT